MMYKTHCQCILDTAINANFEEVSIKHYIRIKQIIKISYIIYVKLWILSSGNASFPFYVDFFFPLSPTRVLSDLTMSNTVGVL